MNWTRVVHLEDIFIHNPFMSVGSDSIQKIRYLIMPEIYHLKTVVIDDTRLRYNEPSPHIDTITTKENVSIKTQ